MKSFKLFGAALAALLMAASCDIADFGKDVPESQPVPGNIILLNNGNWGSNDASVTLYDFDSKSVTGNAFFKANQAHVGDLGQDMIACGEDIFIAVNGSQVIFVTDHDLKIRQKIVAKHDGISLSPRSFALGEGKLYVTYYEGYLGEIDLKTYEVRTTSVGPNPEGLAYADGRIYVANSGGYVPGYANTVSVVSANVFMEIATIKVNTNPAAVLANSEGSKIYVSSIGNYADIQPKLEVIDVATYQVKDCGYQDVKSIAMGADDCMYVVTGGYDANWNIAGSVYRHNAATDTKAGKFTEQVISPYYSLSVDPASGLVFVGTSDYMTNGDVYVYTSDGSLYDKFDALGLNPQKVIRL